MYRIVLNFFCCVFFKQKTAYEMRISDWSSDVCSSDLRCWPCAPPICWASAGPHATRSWTSWRSGWAWRARPARYTWARSEERRVGNECVRACTSQWSPGHSKKKQLEHYMSTHKIHKQHRQLVARRVSVVELTQR